MASFWFLSKYKKKENCVQHFKTTKFLTVTGNGKELILILIFQVRTGRVHVCVHACLHAWVSMCTCICIAMGVRCASVCGSWGGCQVFILSPFRLRLSLSLNPKLTDSSGLPSQHTPALLSLPPRITRRLLFWYLQGCWGSKPLSSSLYDKCFICTAIFSPWNFLIAFF